MIYHVSKQILNNAKDYWIKNASEIQNVIGNSLYCILVKEMGNVSSIDSYRDV
jgi:hypothetical protein